MKLIFLGSGSAFTVGHKNYQSNMLLVDEQDNKLLIDCGSDIRFSLHEEGFSYTDITDIYISHLHSDHAGGLEYIGLGSKFNRNCQKPNLYLSKDIASSIWHNTLSGGMQSVEGQINELDDFFTIYKIDKNGYFTWQDIKFYLIPVTHIHNGFYIMPTYGLFFKINGIKIWLTADTQLCLKDMEPYYEKADLIFHDCETTPYPTPVHSHYQQLLTLPEHFKNKIWLYGYQGDYLPDAKKDGFFGFVQRGQVFEF
jgi:ribonuclease BN (tRNA processing enzyme)